MQDQPANPQIISYVIAGAVLVLVMFFRMRNVGRQRRLRLEWLWVLPAILLALMTLTMISAPPSPLTLGLSAVALLIGGAVGWQRGRMMQIHVDPATHELNQVNSMAAMMFIVVIIALRLGARAVVDAGILPVHVDPVAMTDVLLSFVVGMFGIARLEMFLRARRLLAGAREKAGSNR